MSNTTDAVCRPGCGACCIVISISSPLPGMPLGKPAGVPCANLDSLKRCLIHGTEGYPPVCANFKPSREMCGESYEDAARWLGDLESLTSPRS